MPGNPVVWNSADLDGMELLAHELADLLDEAEVDIAYLIALMQVPKSDSPSGTNLLVAS